MEKTRSRKRRGGGWSNKSPDQVPIFRVRFFPFPTHTLDRVLSQQSCKTYKERFSVLAPLPGCLSARSARSPNPRAGRDVEEKENRVRRVGDHHDRTAGPGGATGLTSPWAALPTAMGEGPGGVARSKPLPGGFSAPRLRPGPSG